MSIKVFIAGHKGMVGSAIYNQLSKNSKYELLSVDRKELDLRNQAAVLDFFKSSKPEIVIDAAAKVGGILANNNYPWQFIHDNIVIQSNIINAAHLTEVRKFIFLGSSCIYPKFAEQPIKEESLLTGSLEPTNEWYAIAKIAGVKMCEALRSQYEKDFISIMPTNLYGPRDNFDLKTSHVLPAMIRKFHDAKNAGNIPVNLWGTGSPMREFLHVEDVAHAIEFVLDTNMKYSLYNLGTGQDITIKNLANLIQGIVGHTGEINWDTSKPDGTPRKLLDVSRLTEEGWNFKINLIEGIKNTYNWYLSNLDNFKEVKI